MLVCFDFKNLKKSCPPNKPSFTKITPKIDFGQSLSIGHSQEAKTRCHFSSNENENK